MDTAAPLSIGILTISDRASAGVYEDKSGAAIRDVLTRWVASTWREEYRLVPDEQPQIEAALKELSDSAGCAVIVTTGGTGPAPRDVTPEATAAVCDRLLPGFGEQMRAVSVRTVPTAILSRANRRDAGLDLHHQPARKTCCNRGVPRGGVSRHPILCSVDWRAEYCNVSRRPSPCALSAPDLKDRVVSLSPELLKILVCPKSKGALEYHKGPPESLVCRESRLVYAVQDGIPIMLIDEARPLDDAEFPPAT